MNFLYIISVWYRVCTTHLTVRNKTFRCITGVHNCTTKNKICNINQTETNNLKCYKLHHGHLTETETDITRQGFLHQQTRANKSQFVSRQSRVSKTDYTSAQHPTAVPIRLAVHCQLNTQTFRSNHLHINCDMHEKIRSCDYRDMNEKVRSHEYNTEKVRSHEYNMGIYTRKSDLVINMSEKIRSCEYITGMWMRKSYLTINTMLGYNEKIRSVNSNRRLVNMIKRPHFIAISEHL